MAKTLVVAVAVAAAVVVVVPLQTPWHHVQRLKQSRHQRLWMVGPAEGRLRLLLLLGRVLKVPAGEILTVVVLAVVVLAAVMVMAGVKPRG